MSCADSKETCSIPLEPTCHDKPLGALCQLLCCPVVKTSQLCKAFGLRPFSPSAQPLAGRRIWGRTPHLLQFNTVMTHISRYSDLLCMLPLPLSRSPSVPPLQSTCLPALFRHHPASYRWLIALCQRPVVKKRPSSAQLPIASGPPSMC